MINRTRFKSAVTPKKKKCKFCQGMAILMTDQDGMSDYYYHYSTDYSKGCHQRISLNNKERMKSLTTWTKEDCGLLMSLLQHKDDEIRNLKENLERLAPAREFYSRYCWLKPWERKIIKWIMR